MHTLKEARKLLRGNDEDREGDKERKIKVVRTIGGRFQKAKSSGFSEFTKEGHGLC